MTNNERAQNAAVIALLAVILGVTWALQQGLDLQGTALTAGLAYGVSLALTGPLQAPLGATVLTSIKYAGITIVFALWVAGTGAHAGWQLLRGRIETKGVFA